MGTLALCLPQRDQVQANYANCLASLVMETIIHGPPQIDNIGIISRRGSLVITVRNDIVTQALSHEEITHLLWIDDDHEFPADAAIRLLAHERPYVGINATTRTPPHRYTAWKKPGEMLETTPQSKGIERVWRMGLGLCLIEARVFRELQKPWFATPWIDDDEGTRFLGEDNYFCEHARKRGYQPMVDHDLTKETAHIGVTNVTHEEVDMSELVEEFGLKR